MLYPLIMYEENTENGLFPFDHNTVFCVALVF